VDPEAENINMVVEDESEGNEPEKNVKRKEIEVKKNRQ
jgi:hypothetical protein